MEQAFVCKHCNTRFHKESTLFTHMCVKKRRHMDLGSTGSRIGFRAFQRFYELTSSSKKSKTAEDFIESPYYIDFVKFGNYVSVLKPVHNDQFVDFLIKNSVKLKDWTKDFVFDLYINDLVKKEPSHSAVERTILEIYNWCEQNKFNLQDFFKKVSPNVAAHMIRTGKISPWVLYLSDTGEDLLNRFTEDHSGIIGEIIDPAVWARKFKKDTDDVTYIKSVLRAAGL